MLIPSIGIRLAVFDVSTGIITFSRLTNTSSLTSQATVTGWNTSVGSSWSTVYNTIYDTEFLTQWATGWYTTKTTTWNTDRATVWNTTVSTAKPTILTSFFGTSEWTAGAINITHHLSRNTLTEWQIGIVRNTITEAQWITATNTYSQPITLTQYLTGWLTDYGGFSILTEVGTSKWTATGSWVTYSTQWVTNTQTTTQYIETVFKNTTTKTLWDSVEVGSGWITNWDTIVENQIYTNIDTLRSTSKDTSLPTAQGTSVLTSKLTDISTIRNTTISTNHITSNASIWNTSQSTNTEWTTEWDTNTEWTTSN